MLQRAVLRMVGVKSDQLPLVDDRRADIPTSDPTYDMSKAVETEMERNPFVHSALTKKAAAISSIPFFVQRRTEKGWERVDHPAEHVVEGGNPYMTTLSLKRILVYHKELTGSGYWQVARSSSGKPEMVQPLYPQHMKVIPSSTRYLAGYEYRIGSGDPVRLQPEQVMWSRYPHPASPYRGLAPLKSIQSEVDTDLAAIMWNLSSLRGRGATDAAFILKDVKTQEQYDLAKRMILDRYAGTHNGRAPWIIGGDSDVRPLSFNALEMDYLNTRIFNRQVVAAAFGVPAPLIGDADNSTYNNLDTLKRVFWEDTVTGWLEELRQDLTTQILLPYWKDGRSSRPVLRFQYDLSNVEALAQNWKEKAEIAKLLSQAGFLPEQINDRLELGMTFTPGMQQVQEAERGDVEKAIAEFIERELSLKHDPRKWLPQLHHTLASSRASEPDVEEAVHRAEVLASALDKIGHGGSMTMLARGVARNELEAIT